MTTKKLSMNYNISDQDLINYNQTNFSIENTNMNIINNNINELNISNSSNKSQENLIEIELKNIHMLILQRSLYILKKKFEQNKKDIELVYEKYKDQKYRQLKCVNTKNLFDLFQEIMEINQINLLPYENFNELITANFMSDFNKEKYNTMLNALTKFTKKNIEKYNTIFYENKMKKKKNKLEQINNNYPKPELEDVTDQAKIIHKDKRGNIIDNFEKMIENNKKIEIDDMIFSINEDDMSILVNKQLLYTDVIILIIADFLQEFMKNNINIGIILSNNSFANENDDLNEGIKVLYDKEIIKKYNNLNKIDPKEEKKETLKNLLFESNNIDNQIMIYKELIVENSNKGIESSYLIEMIRKLKDKKNIIENKISEMNQRKYYNEHHFKTLNQNNNLELIDDVFNQSKLNKSKNNSKIHLSKKLTKNEIRKNNLFEIFSFYSKQHILLGKTPTINSLLEKEKNMNLSEFAKFCKEFQIMVKSNKINEIFKKFTKSATYMSFEEFLQSLSKISVLVNEEKKQYIKERININELNLKEIIEKEKKKKTKKGKKKKKINSIPKENQNIEQTKNDEEKKIVEQANTEIKDNKENNKKQEQIEKNEAKEIKQREENKNNNIENKEVIEKENKEKKNEEKKEENNEYNLLDKNENEKNPSSNSIINDNNEKKQQIKKEEKSLLLNSKEELEAKISTMKKDYMNLESKSNSQLEEELFIYLGIDDSSLYRKKMVGYVQPFLIRGKDTRNPEKNVKYPVKFNPKNIRDMYDLLMQRSEDLKKEKELKKMKEKEKQYEKRKQKFNKELRKLERDYDVRIKKDNYQQIKKIGEDYKKEKNNKLTWQLIQNCDYQNFLLNEDSNYLNNPKKKKIKTNLDDIFEDQDNQFV